MFQVRIHGRGGQGVVTATELLSVTPPRPRRPTALLMTNARPPVTTPA